MSVFTDETSRAFYVRAFIGTAVGETSLSILAVAIFEASRIGRDAHPSLTSASRDTINSSTRVHNNTGTTTAYTSSRAGDSLASVNTEPIHTFFILCALIIINAFSCRDTVSILATETWSTVNQSAFVLAAAISADASSWALTVRVAIAIDGDAAASIAVSANRAEDSGTEVDTLTTSADPTSRTVGIEGTLGNWDTTVSLADSSSRACCNGTEIDTSVDMADFIGLALAR